MSSYQEIQNDEKIAIQSIYEEAVFETNAWNVWKPLKFKLRLLPVQSTSRGANSFAHVSLDFTVTCSDKYPDDIPVYALENVKGISAADTNSLQENINQKIQELKGSPMILDLCELIRSFLYEKDVPVSSFHENMIKQQAHDLSNKNRCRANSEKREFEQIAEERELKQTELQWKDDSLEKIDCTNMEMYVIGPHRVYKRDDEKVRTIQHTSCKEWRGVFSGEDVLVSEWTFHHSCEKSNKINKQIDVEGCNNLIKELEVHLTSYLQFMNSEQTIAPVAFTEIELKVIQPNNIHFLVYIGQKISVNHLNLSTFPLQKDTSQMIKRLAAHAVFALRFLHNRQLSHGVLSNSSIWYFNNTFIFSDSVLLSLMCWATNCFKHLCSEFKNIKQFVTGDASSQKMDLFSLGTILHGLRTKHSSSLSLFATTDDMDDFISTCQTSKSVEDLMEHKYLVMDMLSDTGSLPQWNVESIDGKKSRLIREFFLQKQLGRGGFGDVVLAKNKIDSSNYAVKRIPLYPKNQKLNRKITQEAELFAKLNHPNVVRYYNAWMEDVNPVPSISSSKSTIAEREDSMLPSRLRQIENRCEPIHAETSEWSMSYRPNDSLDSSSDEEEYDNKPGITLFDNRTDDSDGICFENSNDDKENSSEKQTTGSENSEIKTQSTTSTEVQSLRLLYIQMEFCENSTLRGCIDRKELHLKSIKIWKLFNDMLKGLQYIHENQMIHRDITPANILIDGAGHAKIGDFGLATYLFLRKDSEGRAMPIDNNSQLPCQTRDIGTELYMAPELFVLDDKKPYTSKIDVYSAGVVLFEMFYRPLPLGQDRISTMRSLKKTSTVPDDFNSGYSTAQANLAKKFIESMLQYDADLRPTIAELIANNERPVAEIGDEGFQRFFSNVVSKRSGRMYNWVVDSMFEYDGSVAKNYYFDSELCEEKYKNNKDHIMHEVKEELSLIFQLRSFVPLYNHLLTPDTCVPKNSELRSKLVNLIDRTGFIVGLPVDLKFNFVRFCLRNSVKRFKRFTFDRVFAKKTAIDSHPLERWECSIDCIVAEKSAITLTTELLSSVYQIADEMLKNMNCTLRIGNFHLIEAALEHLTVKKDNAFAVLQAFHKFFTSPKPLTSQAKFDSISQILGPKIATSLLSLLPIETSFATFKDSCRTLLKSRNAAVRAKAEAAISHLEQLMEALQAATPPHASNMNIIFDATTIYRPTIYRDGVLFILTVEVPQKKGTKNTLVLAGGRYDSMLEEERQTKDLLPPYPLCLIGCSISLDVLCVARERLGESMNFEAAVVCSYYSDFLIEKFSLAKELWNLQIQADIFHEPVDCIDSLHTYCNQKSIAHILVIFGNDEVLVCRYGENLGKMSFASALQLFSEVSEEHVMITSTPVSSSRTPHQSTTPRATTASHANCNFTFAEPDKLDFKKKRKIEGRVQNILGEVLSIFSPKCKIEVCINALSSDLIKLIAGSLKRTTTRSELQTLFQNWGKQYGKSKQDLECVYQYCCNIYSNTGTSSVLILYSHTEEFYKIII